MTKKTLMRQFYEIEKEHSKRLNTQNKELAFGAVIVMWIQMFLVENPLIWILTALPLIYVMTKDLFCDGYKPKKLKKRSRFTREKETMSKKQESEFKETLIIVFIGTFLFITLLIFMAAGHYHDESFDKECLNSIAESYCEENNLIFHNAYTQSFRCYENERSIDSIDFKFTNEERESCKIKEKKQWRSHKAK